MIREYQERDIDAVMTVWTAATALAQRFLSADYIDREEHNTRHIYMAFADSWVLEVDGTVVGYVAVVKNEISGLYVDPTVHGRGHGRALVDKAVAEFGDVRVEVFAKNDIARRFFAAYGFTAGTVFSHDPTGEPALRMTYTPASLDAAASSDAD